MIKYTGNIASKGIAYGEIQELKSKDTAVRRERIESIDEEIKRFEEAQEKAITQLDELYEIALKEVGEANAMIFDVHKMMVEDDDYVDSVKNIITTQSMNAEYAVAVTGHNFAEIFASMDDEYMQGRAADVEDISDRIVAILSNRQDQSLSFEKPCVIVADDLTPSETVQMDKSKILAFVTRKGSVNSHTAILSRTMAIPAIVSVDMPTDLTGKMAVVDGFKGEFIVEPEEEVLTYVKEIQEREEKKKALLKEYKGRETVTKSGKKINLYANVGSVGDVGLALQNDSEGVGLFRSEFLYLECDDFPTEEMQFNAYKQAAEMLAGKKVIIRTMDIGADKQIDYLDLGEEENPALGYRAVRICLTQEEIFRTQLRALVRASGYGKISIMVPMICSVWEVERVKEILEEVKQQIQSEGFRIGDIEFGIMIETPAAVMIADDLAPLVDFFSVGTNDLTQYTLAIDRQNEKLNRFYDAHHPAVLKMIKQITDVAHKHNIWAGICGELAADTTLTKTFVEYGVDELSVTPSVLLAVRQAVCELD